MPLYKIFFSEKDRPFIQLAADRVKPDNGQVSFYDGEELVAAFQCDKIAGFARVKALQANAVD